MKSYFYCNTRLARAHPRALTPPPQARRDSSVVYSHILLKASYNSQRSEDSTTTGQENATYETDTLRPCPLTSAVPWRFTTLSHRHVQRAKHAKRNTQGETRKARRLVTPAVLRAGGGRSASRSARSRLRATTRRAHSGPDATPCASLAPTSLPKRSAHKRKKKTGVTKYKLGRHNNRSSSFAPKTKHK